MLQRKQNTKKFISSKEDEKPESEMSTKKRGVSFKNSRFPNQPASPTDDSKSLRRSKNRDLGDSGIDKREIQSIVEQEF